MHVSYVLQIGFNVLFYVACKVNYLKQLEMAFNVECLNVFSMCITQLHIVMSIMYA